MFDDYKKNHFYNENMYKLIMKISLITMRKMEFMMTRENIFIIIILHIQILIRMIMIVDLHSKTQVFENSY